MKHINVTAKWYIDGGGTQSIYFTSLFHHSSDRNFGVSFKEGSIVGCICWSSFFYSKCGVKSFRWNITIQVSRAYNWKWKTDPLIKNICSKFLSFIVIYLFFLIGNHSMQGWTTIARHGATRKRSAKSLKHTGNLFRKNLWLIGACWF